MTDEQTSRFDGWAIVDLRPSAYAGVSTEVYGQATLSTTLFLHSRCHPTAPLRAEKSGNLLTLRCYLPECGRVVARLQLQDEG